MGKQLERRDVDRLYRNLPETAKGLWFTTPAVFDSQPRERRPVDELPGDVTDYLSRVVALEKLTRTQRVVFERVVMGVAWRWQAEKERYVMVWIGPQTYEECARDERLSSVCVGVHLYHARNRLARILSDEWEEAA